MDKADKAVVVAYCAVMLFVIAFWGTVGFIALHFLRKVW